MLQCIKAKMFITILNHELRSVEVSFTQIL